MKIEDLLLGDKAFLYMERYVDENTKTYSPFANNSEVRPEFQPKSYKEFFELIAVYVPRSQVSLFQAHPLPEVKDFYIKNDEVLFLIHPEVWESSDINHIHELHTFRRGEPIRVAPTASTRTVLTTVLKEQFPIHFIKLHYPRRISRFNRRLRMKNIRNSVYVTEDLEQIKFDKFAYLPDTLGISLSNDIDSWGFLIRERKPRPHREDRYLIPFFALYGGDLKDSTSIPLLVQMIDHLKVEPQTFVLNELMIPLIECWCKVVRERGILLESHAQNTLLEVDKYFRPRRIVHRDFDVWIDEETREKKGLSSSQFLSNISKEEKSYPRTAHYSLIYDHFIGRELFDYLAKVLIQYYCSNENAICKRVSEAFHLNFPDAKNFFPTDTTFYFSNEILPENEYTLVDTKQKPKWR